MKRISTLVLAFSAFFAFSQNQENVSATAPWTGYMNVFDLNGSYMFGDSWTVYDLQTQRDSTADEMTLRPNFNTYANAIASGAQADLDYWTDGNNGGNKSMEASTFVEPGATYNGQDLTFKGRVISNTISSDYEVKYFIKALDPNNGFADALGGSKVLDMPASGEFEVTATGAELASGLIIQYGFSVIGINANPDSVNALGSVVVGPSSLGQDEESAISSQVSFYPNPTTDVLFIKDAEDYSSYSIYSLLGEKVDSGSLSSSINMSDLKSGVYFINLTSADLSTSFKVVKR